MPRRFTMAVLRTRCQQRVDKEVDGSLAAPGEWNALISEAYGDLWTAVVQTGMRYFETSVLYVTDGSLSYLEPADHYETVNVSYVYDTVNGGRRDLDEAMVQEVSRYSGLKGPNAWKYAIVDDRFFLYPTPPAGQTYEMLYVQQPTDLSSYQDSQLVDVVTPAGEEFMIWAVAVKASHKSETDASFAIAERDGCRAKLVEEATMRALNAPRRRQVRDVYDDGNAPYWDPADWYNRR